MEEPRACTAVVGFGRHEHQVQPGPGLHEAEPVFEAHLKGEGHTEGRRGDTQSLGPVLGTAFQHAQLAHLGVEAWNRHREIRDPRPHRVVRSIQNRLRSTPHWRWRHPMPGRVRSGRTPPPATAARRRSWFPPPGKCRPGTVQSRLHSALGDTQKSGGLGFAQPVDIAQYENGALLGSKACECRPHVHDRGDVNWGNGAAGKHVRVEGVLPSTARDTDSLSHRDPPHPAVERRGLAQRSEVPQHGDESLLHGVVSTVKGNRPAHPAHVGHECAHQRVHGRGVTSPSRSDELLHVYKRLRTLGRFRGVTIRRLAHHRWRRAPRPGRHGGVGSRR